MPQQQGWTDVSSVLEVLKVRAVAKLVRGVDAAEVSAIVEERIGCDAFQKHAAHLVVGATSAEAGRLLSQLVYREICQAKQTAVSQQSLRTVRTLPASSAPKDTDIACSICLTRSVENCLENSSVLRESVHCSRWGNVEGEAGEEEEGGEQERIFASAVPETSWTALECRHRFHTPCLLKWVSRHASCPLCRGPVR